MALSAEAQSATGSRLASQATTKLFDKTTRQFDDNKTAPAQMRRLPQHDSLLLTAVTIWVGFMPSPGGADDFFDVVIVWLPAQNVARLVG